MSIPEMFLLYNPIIRNLGTIYWLGSPYSFENGNAYEREVLGGNLNNIEHVDNSSGIRPSVSLTPGTRYSSGDGSMANPYVVETE